MHMLIVKRLTLPQQLQKAVLYTLTNDSSENKDIQNNYLSNISKPSLFFWLCSL